MTNKAWETVQLHQMLRQGDRVVAGVSGGADSVALLDFLCWAKAGLKLDILVCHVNHNLRGEEGERDACFVTRLCRRLEIPVVVEQADVPAAAREQKCSVETAARTLRYEILGRLAGGGGRIAVAHTADDSLETMLMNLARGAGLRGLCGIPPVRDNIIRPLIACTRAEIEAHCAARGLAYVTDSTNLSDHCTRNRLRHQVVPLLRELNPALPQAAAAMAARLRADADFLDRAAAAALEGLRREEGYDRAGLLALDEALLSRALLRIIGEHAQPSARLVSLCREALQAGRGRQELSRGRWFYADSAAAGVTQEQPLPPPVELTMERPRPGEERQVWAGNRPVRLTVQRISPDNYEKFYKRPLKNALDYDKLLNTFILRSRRTGDRLTLARRGLTKTLKKLFQEEGLTPAQRAGRLVLSDGRGLLWVEGFGPDARCAPGAETRLLLLIEPGGETSIKRGTPLGG